VPWRPSHRILAVYVRSAIGAPGGDEAQVFFVVSLDSCGWRSWPAVRFVTPIWEWIHNRATADMLNRLKDLCESPSRDRRPFGA
jgi:hypothetical protein